MENKSKHKSLSKIILYSAKFRISIILLVMLITILSLFFIAGYPKLRFNPDLRSLIPNSATHDKIIKDRTNSDYLVVALEQKTNGPNLFSKKVLDDIQKIMIEFSEIDKIDVAVSPFEQIKFTKIGNKNRHTFRPEPLLKKSRGLDVPYDFSNNKIIDQFKNDLLKNPITRRLVINDDATMLAFMLDHSNYPDTKKLSGIVSKVLDKYPDSFNYSLSGTAIFEKVVASFLVTDLGVLLGLGLLLSLLLFFFSFRSLRAIFLPASVVIIGTIWMLGTMALIGIEISIVSIIAPPLILALGSSYCIHVLNQYYREVYAHSNETKAISVFKSISKINSTILMASATTVIALLGLLVGTITQTREFSISTSIGIIYSALLSLFYLPAALSLFKLPGKKIQTSIRDGFIARNLRLLAPWIIKWRYLLLFIFIIISFSPAISRYFMSYNSDYISYFNKEEQAVKDTANISKNLSGITQLYIDYEIDEKKYKAYRDTLLAKTGKEISSRASFYRDLNSLNKISDFEKSLEKNEDIRYLLSFPKILCEINETMGNGYSIPKDFSQRLNLRKMFRLLNMQDSIQFNLIQPNERKMTTVIRLADLKNYHGYIKEDDLEKFINQLNSDLKSGLPDYINFKVDGNRVDFIGLRKIMNKDLKVTTIFSSLLIFLTLSLVFRNIAYGFYALIPMLSGISLNFTIMAIFGIPLDMTTIMVSCVAIGIGVDDSVHFLLKFNHFYDDLKGKKDRLLIALKQTMELTGRPIILTSISIILGMSMMLFAQFKPIKYFGFLVAVALFTTTIGCLLFLPMVISIHCKLNERQEARHAKKEELSVESNE